MVSKLIICLLIAITIVAQPDMLQVGANSARNRILVRLGKRSWSRPDILSPEDYFVKAVKAEETRRLLADLYLTEA